MKKTAVLVFSLFLMLGLFAGCTDGIGGPGTTKATTVKPFTTTPGMTTTAGTTTAMTTAVTTTGAATTE